MSVEIADSGQPDDAPDQNGSKPQRGRRVKVWDAPTRLFHWAIVALIGVSWVTADRGWITAHLWSGSAIFALLVFRIGWGFTGSTTARFSSFIAGPWKSYAYLRGLMRAETQHFAGHNPAGGTMVVALIAVLCFQVATGLFSNDGVEFQAPLATLISSETSDLLSELHALLFVILLVLAWGHLVAAFFYLFVRGENLIWPMITGHKSAEHLPPDVSVRFTSFRVALALLGAAAGLAWWVALR
jgi:cytochrome b